MGNYSHTEGNSSYSQAEVISITDSTTDNEIITAWRSGHFSLAKGVYSHVEGNECLALGAYTHAEGNHTMASENCSHSEGNNTTASGYASHAEGAGTTASSEYQHVQGKYNIEDSAGKYAFIIGNGTSDGRSNAFAIDWDGKIYVNNATEGVDVSKSSGGGVGKDVTGTEYTIAGVTYTAGDGAEIFNDYSSNKAIGMYSHAEGVSTTASGVQSHAEGAGTTASGSQSHAEGASSTASGPLSHAEGGSSVASGPLSHAEGNCTTASGQYSHSEGYYTKASSDYQHVQGKYNTEDTESKYAFIIGNGTSNTARSNAFAIDWDGNIYINNASTGVNVATLASDLASLQTQIQTLTDRVAALENA